MSIKYVKYKKGIKVTCHHCGYVWIYMGASNYFCTCPQCHYNTRVIKPRAKPKRKVTKKVSPSKRKKSTKKSAKKR